MLLGMMSYYVKLTGEGLSRKSIGLLKAECERKIGDIKLTESVYISLPYIMAARTPGIDRNKEITSQSLYVCHPSPYQGQIDISMRFSSVAILTSNCVGHSVRHKPVKLAYRWGLQQVPPVLAVQTIPWHVKSPEHPRWICFQNGFCD